ncbi:MAG: polyprenyl synthetase family protein [Ilumatobacteraceae bacterium]
MPRLLTEVNARPELARAALANPLFAVEELGWSIDEGVRSTFERRIRFTADLVARLDALGVQIGEITGRHVELDDPHEVARLLFDQLKLPVPGAPARRTRQRQPGATIHDALPTAPLPPRLTWSPEPAPDQLAEPAGAHPVIAPLLEFRHLDAGVVEHALDGDRAMTVQAMVGYLTDREPRRHLYDLVADDRNRPGEALRPSLCPATCGAFGGDVGRAVPMAVTLELIHNGFLVHDGLEDGSDHRRGWPTMHRLHGSALAINAGDAMYVLVLRPLTDCRGTLGPGFA